MCTLSQGKTRHQHSELHFPSMWVTPHDPLSHISGQSRHIAWFVALCIILFAWFPWVAALLSSQLLLVGVVPLWRTSTHRHHTTVASHLCQVLCSTNLAHSLSLCVRNRDSKTRHKEGQGCEKDNRADRRRLRLLVSTSTFRSLVLGRPEETLTTSWT